MNALLYGAYGYTGELTARLAVEQGLKPTLSGRNEQKLREVAERYDLPYVVASLDDVEAVLRDFPVVMHCAGPFSRTSRPMVDACLATGTHYLDITGEVPVFQACRARDQEAKDAGIMLLPGIGFDVAPTDCLAVWLAQQLPGATELHLAVLAGGQLSHGTMTTVVENLTGGSLARQGGELVPTRTAVKVRQVAFPRGERSIASAPLGDLVSAHHSTGIANITTYLGLPPKVIRMMRTTRSLTWIAGWPPIQRLLQKRIDALPAGPDDEVRAAGWAQAWGEVVRGDERLQGHVGVCEGYTFTALCTLLAAKKVLEGTHPTGYQTPATAFGPDLVLELGGERALVDA